MAGARGVLLLALGLVISALASYILLNKQRTLIADKLNLVSGIELGYGGVYVGAAPHFLFIPDLNATPLTHPLIPGFPYIPSLVYLVLPLLAAATT